ncbi:tetratricopeptide repeat protein [Lentimicrobium sp.]
MIRTYFLNFVSLLLLFSSSAFGQQTTANQAPANDAKMTAHLFHTQKYEAARNLSSRLIPPDDLLIAFDVEKDYYTSASAAELEQEDAPALLRQFLEKYPENTRTNLTWFRLGNLEFKNRKYRDALQAFEKVDTYEFNQETNAEYAFKRGYCYFMAKDMDMAARLFEQVKDKQTRYTGPASYYFAHIMYENGNYPLALFEFEKLRQDQTFKSVVPYYIIQIYYLQGKYDEMLELSQPYLDGPRNKRTNEILRLVADVNYRKGNYTEVIDQMEEYQRMNRGRVSREESYVLAYSYYSTRAYEKAIPNFQQVTGVEDTLAQNAWYHLGDSYLKTDQKQFAYNAFSAAWKIPVQSAIAEDALFNYAKLSIELSYNPYNEAIKALQQYLSTYPSSPRRDEAYTYLANLYLVTKNYREALSVLEKVTTRNRQQNEIYQKITYFRGLELFSDKQYFEAIELFNKSLENKADAAIAAGATYWTGEAYYRLGQYELALGRFQQFSAMPAAANYTPATMVNYNIGYALMKLKRYQQAIPAFSGFIAQKNAERVLKSDATLRLADCHFMTKNYTEASGLYDQVIAARGADGDYALYQKSLCLGITNNTGQKITSLQKLVSTYPKSNYADDALYEMGQAHLSLQQNDQALKQFQQLISEYPGSSYVKPAILNTGLIYYNTNRNQQALETFKKVVRDYPATPESREALAVIKSIYVDMNRVDDFVNYAADVPFANVSRTEQDSLSFSAAEARYMANDCAMALPGFKTYLEKFPQGIFALNAHYYKADCETRAGNHNEAVQDYLYVTSRPRNRFTENAALKGAGLLYRMENWSEALTMYNILGETAENEVNRQTAMLGQMRCNAKLGNQGVAMQMGQRLLQSEKLSTDLIAESQLVVGNAALALGKPDMAYDAYNEVVKNSPGALGAEAAYQIAFISFQKADYTQAEKQVFKVTTDYASYDYWVAKAFILLADVYVKTGNDFQAKQTLQSIIDNYEGADLRNEAIAKLKALQQKDKPAQPAGSHFDDDDDIMIR